MNDVRQTTVDAAISAAGSKLTYTGASVSTLGWFTSSEAGVLIGILIGLIGLIVNLHFKRREDKRQEAEHQVRMKAIMKDMQL